jgi:hypothetical protein
LRFTYAEGNKREHIKELIMEKKNVMDKRAVRLEDVMKKDYIPFLGGRPVRTTMIGKDDIVDLKIRLNTTTTVESFLKNL